MAGQEKRLKVLNRMDGLEMLPTRDWHDPSRREEASPE